MIRTVILMTRYCLFWIKSFNTVDMALTNKTEPKPFIEMTDGALKELDDIGKAFEQSRKVTEDLKSVGFDVKKLEEMIEMGEKMRAIVVKRFT